MQEGFGLLKDGKDADKNKEALKAFNKALEVSPEYSDLYFLRAMILYYLLGSSDYKNMLSDIDKALALHPTNKDNSAYKTTAPHLSMKAKVYKDKGDWHKAIQTLENAINLDPDDSITPSGIDPNKPEIVKNWSKQDFDEIIKKYPKDYRGYLFRGLYYDYFTKFDGKNYAIAVRDYKKAIGLNPKSALSHYLLGKTISRKLFWNPEKTIEDYRKEYEATNAGLSVYTVYPQDYKDMVAALSAAIRLNPEMVDAYRARADVYLTAKEYKLAIKDYDKLVELDPNYAGTYHDRAIAYKELGQYEEAIRDLSKAIELKHSRHDWPRSAYEVRAYVYEAMGKYEDAINDYTKALEVWEKVSGEYIKKDFGSIIAYDILDRRAKNYRKLKQYQKAIDDYTEAISWIPAGPPSMVFADRGDAYMELEKPAEAIKDYDLAIESNRKQNKELSKSDSMSKMDTLSSEYLAKKAGAYATLEKYDLAFESYNKALNAVDDYPPFKGKIYQEMGMLYRSLGINQEAIKACSLAVKYLPLAGEDPFLAYLELGNAYSDIGDHKEALRVFTEMIKLYPNVIVSYLRRGYKYYETKDYNRAVIDFNKAIDLKPTNQYAYYYRALARIGLEQHKQGIEDLRIAARLGHKEAQEKLKENNLDWQ
jgi:tetratricopeptide (TPR) repeat protein